MWWYESVTCIISILSSQKTFRVEIMFYILLLYKFSLAHQTCYSKHVMLCILGLSVLWTLINKYLIASSVWSHECSPLSNYILWKVCTVIKTVKYFLCYKKSLLSLFIYTAQELKRMVELFCIILQINSHFSRKLAVIQTYV